MEHILADLTASISELKKSPMALIEKAGDAPVAIMNDNKVMAYLVPAKAYETLLDRLEDYELGKIVEERLAKPELGIAVSLDDL